MKLNLYTANYPYGFSESFLTNELNVLKNEITDIKILPYTQNGNIQAAFDTAIPVVKIDKVKFNMVFKDYLFLLRILLIELLNCSNKGFFLKKIKRHAVILKNAIILSKSIAQSANSKDSLHYSFWMNEWALALAVLKKRNKINRFVFRVNGYDIWNERHEGNYLPFRYFAYSQTNAVYALSETSLNYLKGLNFFPEKIKLAYFGTKELGIKEVKTESKFTVFSCSSAIPLKRLDKIAMVLAQVKSPLKWIHHGEGATIDAVKQIIKESGDNIEFVHSLKKENYLAVLELMQSSAPDLFINLSSTEGLPVTLIEAISFGIPLLANKVGSCHELFKGDIGILVEAEASIAEIATKIDEFIANPEKRPSAQNIKAIWGANFSAQNNYSDFAKQLLSHNKT